MSSSVSYVIKSGNVNVAKNTKYSHVSKDDEVIDKARNVGSISFGVLFSLVYIGVASNFFFNLNHVEEVVRNNCTMMYASTLEWNLNNFCEHVVTWKTCAIFGIVVPGCLYLILGLITMGIVSKQQEPRHRSDSTIPTCEKLWSTFDFLTKVVNIAVFCVLLSSKAHVTTIGMTSGLKTAAVIYMCVVGIEVALILFLIGLGILCSCCACACTAFCCVCCLRCSCFKKNEPDTTDGEVIN